ncbi:hypothetical protein HDU98_006714 [Podochytrium sp. JEL0797]|nr:hypothetical protein HDU98_006714 [Podochytrium sp. JEL0797]
MATAMEFSLYRSCVGKNANVENLVKLCNHYQIANDVDADGSTALTIEQVTERVQKDREAKIRRLAREIAVQEVEVESRRARLLETTGFEARKMAQYILRKSIDTETNFKETCARPSLSLTFSKTSSTATRRRTTTFANRNQKCPQCMQPIRLDQLMKLQPPEAVLDVSGVGGG